MTRGIGTPKIQINKLVTEFVYYESIQGEIQTKPIYECRCDDRLKPEGEESTLLGYTGLIGELEHLKIETRLKDEKFASVMGESVCGRSTGELSNDKHDEHLKNVFSLHFLKIHF